MFSVLPSRSVAVSVLGFNVHWYGLLYLLSFVLAFVVVQRIQHYRNLKLTTDEWSGVLTAAVLGVLIGGRLGFVILYEPQYFLQHPLEIPAVWKGGMASHGGFIGVAVALWIRLRKSGVPMWAFADVIVVPIAIGLAFGRLGNFVNQELYGTVATLPWAIEFAGAEGMRHPTQLYAIAKNLCIGSLCYLHLRSHRSIPGTTFAVFLTLYGILRFLNEFFRVQQHSGFDIGLIELSRGQLYSLPIVVVGLVMYWYQTR